MPPNINESDLIFKPDYNKNAIIYGMKGINRIGSQLVFDTFNNRPYTSIEDFLKKVKINKVQMINLIKSGAFDSLYGGNRIKAMNTYLDLVTDKKSRITLQNMSMLITKNLIPKELEFEKTLFNFNKYLKSFKKDDYYILDDISVAYYLAHFDEDNLEDVVITQNGRSAKILQKLWDKIYKLGMEPIRVWMKENQQKILDDLNNKLLEETAEKYTDGSISKWEMDSLSFYYHDHELENLKRMAYSITDFFSLPEEPEIDRTFETRDGNEIKIFNLERIAGTVIDKDKNKSQVILLTPTGVVTVKVWKNQYVVWDKQISQRGTDGVKHVIEKSWFTKGTKLIITGIRRGDNFIPKKYKDTQWPLFEKIEELDSNGYIVKSATDRIDIEED